MQGSQSRYEVPIVRWEIFSTLAAPVANLGPKVIATTRLAIRPVTKGGEAPKKIFAPPWKNVLDIVKKSGPLSENSLPLLVSQACYGPTRNQGNCPPRNFQIHFESTKNVVSCSLKQQVAIIWPLESISCLPLWIRSGLQLKPGANYGHALSLALHRDAKCGPLMTG